MANKPNVGDSPVVENPQGEPQDTPQPEIPEAYRGKTAEELVAILKDKESQIGKQSEEVGTLRAKMGELENQFAFNQQFGQQREPRPDTIHDSYGQSYTQEGTPTPKEKDDFNWDNPQNSVREIMRKEWQRVAEQAQRRDGEIRQTLFRVKPVLERAKKEAPHLFRGLKDEEVEGAIYNGLNSGLINQNNLTDTRTFKWAASGILGEKTNYSYLMNPNVSPVEPTTTESPVGTRPQEPEEESPLKLDDLGRELLRHRPEGMSESDFYKLVKKGRSE